MRLLIAPTIAACPSSATHAEEQSTKPRLVGTWNNANDSLGCRYLPRTIIIRFVGDRRAEVESEENVLGIWRWRSWPGDLEQVSGPTTGPDYIQFRLSSFQLLDHSHLNHVETAVEGSDHCEYVRAEPPSGSPQL